MRILITGGAGYVGCRLVPALLEDGHDAVVYDTFWFEDHLPNWPQRLYRYKGDIRDVECLKNALVMYGQVDAVIHLACLSNDPSAEIDADLTRAINLEAFEPLVIAVKEAGVRRFINCSTSSVYGVSDAPDVTEDHPHVPITLYNRYKSECEPLLMRHASPEFECVTVRPSTVCGYSPRQRLDLAVNILTTQAYHTGRIIVRGGGQQKRPNLHIEDMVDAYRVLLAAPAHLIQGQTFNVGAGNVSIADLAVMVKEEVERYKAEHAVGASDYAREVGIETVADEFDPRSYQVNSDKIMRVLGFRPLRTVRQAVRDLCRVFDAGLLPDPLDRDEYYNIRTMRRVHADLYADAPPSKFRPEEGVLSEIDMRRGAKA